MGNIQSVKNALDYLGIYSTITDKKEEIVKADKLLLPGVGSYRRAMENLENSGMAAFLKHLIFEKQVPVLGICLGMQLLAGYSDEDGGANWLNLLNAEVKKFDISSDLPVLHVGFNSVHVEKEKSILFRDIEDESDFYFVHSFRIRMENQHFASGTTCYGEKFVSAFEENHIYGTQFHPEKSQSNGLQLLKNYAKV